MKRFIFLPLFATLAACSGHPQDSTGVGNPGLTQSEQALYDDGDDGRRAGDAASALTRIPLLGLATSAALANENNAAGAGELVGKKAFTPAGCVVSTRTTNVVTFTFTDCTYLLGYTHVNGTVEATYTPSATTGAIEVAVKNTGPFTLETYTVDKSSREIVALTVDVTIDAHATVQLTAPNVQRTDWNGTYVAKWPGGSLTHEPTYHSVVDTSSGTTCVDLDGSATTKFASGRGVTVDVSGYHRCGQPKECPAAGGSVSFTSLTDPRLTLKVEFLGGRAVRVTPPKQPGRPDSFELDDLLKCSG
ncbi:MAG: hypothetical protein ACXWUG_09940 [Polyangiales bacterium]